VFFVIDKSAAIFARSSGILCFQRRASPECFQHELSTGDDSFGVLLTISNILLDPDPAIVVERELDRLARADDDDRFRQGGVTLRQFALAEVE